jgi:phosphinothricin acetyltransferase
MSGWTIEAMQESDWFTVREIYREGMATGDATFETDAPEWSEWDAAHLPHSRLVARRGGIVGGWAALSPVSRRAVYAGVAEVSVYVAAAHRGAGLGLRLLAALVGESEAHGIWTLQAAIFPENHASLGLHESLGFRQVGRRERIGQRAGCWRDTVLVERRSEVVGI